MKESNVKMISVIIPIYNPNKEYLEETIKSIQSQSYENYEVLLIVDGEAETTKEIVDRLNDDRFRILINTKGKGLPYSLNRGFKESNGEYIFRMDADDICLPERFVKQVEYLDTHPDIDMVGTFAETFGAVIKTYKSYTSAKEVNTELLFENPIVHPTVALRKDTIEKYGLEYTTGESEDYRLWIEMAYRYGCSIEVIPEVLLKYRMHEGQATVVKKTSIDNMDEKITREILDRLRINLSDAGYDAFNKLRNADRIRLSEMRSFFLLKKELESVLPEMFSVITLKKIANRMLIKKLLRVK